MHSNIPKKRSTTESAAKQPPATSLFYRIPAAILTSIIFPFLVRKLDLEDWCYAVSPDEQQQQQQQQPPKLSEEKAASLQARGALRLVCHKWNELLLHSCRSRITFRTKYDDHHFRSSFFTYDSQQRHAENANNNRKRGIGITGTTRSDPRIQRVRDWMKQMEKLNFGDSNNHDGENDDDDHDDDIIQDDFNDNDDAGGDEEEDNHICIEDCELKAIAFSGFPMLPSRVRCPSLTKLYLVSTNITKDWIDLVLDESPHLESLSLLCMITGERQCCDPLKLPASIEHLSLRDVDDEWIQQALPRLPRLQYLSIFSESLVAPKIGTMKQLKSLIIHCNNIDDRWLSDTLLTTATHDHLPQLEILNVASSALVNPKIQSDTLRVLSLLLARSLRSPEINCPKLEQLFISRANYLDDAWINKTFQQQKRQQQQQQQRQQQEEEPASEPIPAPRFGHLRSLHLLSCPLLVRVRIGGTPELRCVQLRSCAELRNVEIVQCTRFKELKITACPHLNDSNTASTIKFTDCGSTVPAIVYS